MNNKVKVSVIVPIYNVEEYLRECLDSLVNQTLKDIEVLMINDGATDSSGLIAEEYAIKYKNFYNITKINGGLGQARNYGIPFVTGEYIAFMDSDDYISLEGYEKMYKLAERTGNDIVIGNVKRFNSKGVFTSGLHKKVFKETIESTHISKNQDLIYDTTSWNKLFKTTFWKEHNFKFPEGVLYEDIPVTIPAHFKANGVSILEDTVYYWRVRDGINKSITQNRTDTKNFTDRLYVMNMVNKFYDSSIEDDLSIYHRNYKWLDMDLKLYIDELLDADDDYREMLVSEVNKYLINIDQSVRDDLKAIDKIKYYCIEMNDIESLLDVIRYQKTKMKYLKVEKIKNRYIGMFPFEKIPKKYFDMTRELELVKVNKKIEKINWKDNVMNIEGYMYLPKVNIKRKSDMEIKARLINTTTNESVDIDISSVKRKDVTQRSGIKLDSFKVTNRLYNYNWSGFKITLNFDDEKILNLGEGKLKILLECNINSIYKEFYLGEPKSGKFSRPQPHIANYMKVINQYNAAYELIISLYRQSASITKIRINNNNNIEINGWVANYNRAMLINWDYNNKIYKSFNITNEEVDNRIICKEYENVNSFRFNIPFEEINKYYKTGEWYIYYFNNGKREPLSTHCLETTYYKVVKKTMIKIDISKAGTVLIKYDKLKSYLDTIEWDNNNLIGTVAIGRKFLGEIYNVEDVNIRIVNENTKKVIEQEVSSKSVEDDLIKFKFNININDPERYKEFTEDIWIPYIEYKIGGKYIKHAILAENHKLQECREINRHKFNIFRTKKGYLGLNVKQKWNWYEKGPRRREAIERYIYPLIRKLPMKKNTIVFEGWWSKKYHCNPRYLYEYIDTNYPEYECIWSLKDENITINGKGKKVRHNTLKYYYYMATSKYFVNNVNFSDSYVKRDRAVEIQTMHGTPLKTLGLDVKDEFPTQEHIDKFLRRCSRWDYLVVQSNAVSKITDSCYDYSKKYLRTGYPRNDILFEKNNIQDINSVKSELNIAPNKKVILYAPTWRIKDNFDFNFDINKMKEKLGDEYIIITRIHPFAVKGLNKNILDEFIIDYSDYESIEKLYLISDILVTDYSSVMFDYAILDRPILFYTYDLELYRDNLRGFNFDFEKEAPGPLIKDSNELIKSIENIEKITIKNRKKIRKFRKKYCQYEKGHSCEKIFKQVFK